MIRICYERKIWLFKVPRKEKHEHTPCEYHERPQPLDTQ